VSDRAPDALVERKRTIRREVLERRDALPERERRAKSVAIAERVMSLVAVRSAGTVMAFWSFGSEVDTAELIERLHAAGKRVVLPRVEGRDVVAVVFEPGDPTAAASFGAMEPTRADVVDPAAIEVVIAPGVAFDRRGARVGYGGGFYDRFLRAVRPGVLVIAVAFGVQVVEQVPRAEHDRPVDLVVTEDEVIAMRGSARG
jgi:5-formyltetrahydrofolate cyclo-ligase